MYQQKPQTPIDFSKQLIKGKIAELVFDQMFRRGQKYTVIPFGYESIIPEIVQYVEQASRHDLIENIRNAPDFALVKHDPKEVLLVEVKYRSHIDIEKIKETAGRISNQWKLVWLFLATPEGFYFNPCDEILREGRLTPLSEQEIPQAVQIEYLNLIQGFIRG